MNTVLRRTVHINSEFEDFLVMDSHGLKGTGSGELFSIYKFHVF